MNLLILGATGLVGREVLSLALAAPRVMQVVAPTRRALTAHVKLLNPVARSLERLLTQAEEWDVDAIICALGATMGKAGSREAFRRVDHDLPLAFAERARRRGAQSCALVSSPGASPESRFFYPRVKGEIERDIVALGFASVILVRPGMIGGHRQEFRLAERVVMPLASFLRPLLPRALHINPASNIARALLEGVVDAGPGCRLLTSKDLAR